MEPSHPDFSLAEQCAMLGTARACDYYEPSNESEENLHLMQVIDRIYQEHPECGSRLITVMLYRDGYTVSRKRVRRLMRLMVLESIY
jgi:putative transposase